METKVSKENIYYTYRHQSINDETQPDQYRTKVEDFDDGEIWKYSEERQSESGKLIITEDAWDLQMMGDIGGDDYEWFSYTDMIKTMAIEDSFTITLEEYKDLVICSCSFSYYEGEELQDITMVILAQIEEDEAIIVMESTTDRDGGEYTLRNVEEAKAAADAFTESGYSKLYQYFEYCGLPY